MGCVCEIIKRRKLAKIVPTVDSNGKPDNLTESQKAVLRNNWRSINAHIANIGITTFVGYVFCIIMPHVTNKCKIPK